MNTQGSNLQKKKSNLPSRGSFNIIDVAIILLVIVCIIAIYLRFDRETEIALGEGELYTVEFVCEKARYTTEDYVRGDMDVFLSETNRSLGVLGQTVIKPSFEERTVNGRKIIVHYPSDTLVDIYSSVDVRGVMTDGGFLIGGDTYIAPNSLLDISGKNVDLTVRIISIMPAESN